MKVLIGCEYSGRVRQAFRNLGYIDDESESLNRFIKADTIYGNS